MPCHQSIDWAGLFNKGWFQTGQFAQTVKVRSNYIFIVSKDQCVLLDFPVFMNAYDNVHLLVLAPKSDHFLVILELIKR